MGLYVVTAVRIGEDGEVERVRWAPADGAANKFEEAEQEVEVDRVAEAFDRGDVVQYVFPTSQGTVSGGRLIRRILAGGGETVQVENPAEGRSLRDMPLF